MYQDSPECELCGRDDLNLFARRLDEKPYIYYWRKHFSLDPYRDRDDPESETPTRT